MYLAFACCTLPLLLPSESHADSCLALRVILTLALLLLSDARHARRAYIAAAIKYSAPFFYQ